MLYRLQNTVRRFMYGRYGGDALGRFLLGVYFVLWVAGLFLRRGIPGMVVAALSTAVAVLALYRMLSRNILRRQAENDSFLRWWYPTKDWFRHQKDRVRDIKRCRYRRCPQCKAWLRLPIKRGRRTVTCARCHTPFKAFFL